MTGSKKNLHCLDLEIRKNMIDNKLNYDSPTFGNSAWDNGTHSIQNWFERTAWRTLKDTHYGRNKKESFMNLPKSNLK